MKEQLKEILEKFDELNEIIDKKSEKDYKKTKEKSKESIIKMIDDSEKLVWCVTEKGVVANGTGANLLKAISLGLASMCVDKKIPKEIVLYCIEMAYDMEKESDEEDESLELDSDELFKKIKKMIEEM